MRDEELRQKTEGRRQKDDLNPETDTARLKGR
jgi:hypothetical protein